MVEPFEFTMNRAPIVLPHVIGNTERECGLTLTLRECGQKAHGYGHEKKI